MEQLKNSALELIIGIVIGFIIAFMFYFNFAIWKHRISSEFVVDGMTYKCLPLIKKEHP